MKLSTTWAKEWLRRTMSDDEIVQALERAGLEVEQFTSSKSIDKLVVVGLVNKVVQHPQADRLHIVQVSIGGKQLSIVCGAPNVRKGLKVAVAQVGSTLPNGDTIGSAKLRGEVSEGMLCSERELGLGEDHDGILELGSDLIEGVPLCDIYPADGVVDLKTPANRSDVQSVIGLAREVAAMTDTPLREIPNSTLPEANIEKLVSGKPLAARYLLARIAVTAASPSPARMAPRLRAAGMRPISGLVDVTNYSMLEVGQPLHAFDAAKVKLPIEVRKATSGENLTTLDGVKRKLTVDDLVIADTSGPIALAGVMGGASTEVDGMTSEILLELATFDPATVRKTAQRHGLRSEASSRIERGLPSELVPVALNRTLELLAEVANGKLLSLSDYQVAKPKAATITLPVEQLSRLLGFTVTASAAAEALNRLQLGAKASGTSVTVPAVPWWRTDLSLPEDLVEEVVRVLGYDAVPSTIPVWQPSHIQFDHRRKLERQLRDTLYAAGLYEVLTYSFVAHEQLTELGLPAPSDLKLKNPLSSEQGYLRSSLLASHLQVVERNRTFAKELGFYEVANVFLPHRGEQPHEPLRLGLMIVRPQHAYAVAKGLLDAICHELNIEISLSQSQNNGMAEGRSADLSLGTAGNKLGVIGQVDPVLLSRRKITGEAAFLELDLSPLLASATAPQAVTLQRFPAIRRDIAIVLADTITWQEVARVLNEQSQVQASYVSEYYGEGLPDGMKSLAMRLTLSYPDRTPTDAEATEMEQRIVSLLGRKFSASRR